MQYISFERVALSLLLIAAVLGYSASAATVGAVGLMLLDGFKFFISNKKQSEATKEQLLELSAKVDQIDKSVKDRMSLIDNKVAGLGLSRRNA